MDVQKCRVDLSSFGYTLSEVDYSWTSETAVSIAELAINDYTLMEHSQGTTNITTKLGPRSVLTFQFDLSRTWMYKFRINTRYNLADKIKTNNTKSLKSHKRGELKLKI